MEDLFGWETTKTSDPFTSRQVDREAFIYVEHGLSGIGIVSDATIFARRDKARLDWAGMFDEIDAFYATLPHPESGTMNGFRGPDQWDVKKHLRKKPAYVIVNGHKVDSRAWKYLIFLAEVDMRRDRGFANIYNTLNQYEQGMMDAALGLPNRPLTYGVGDYAKGRAEIEEDGPKCCPQVPSKLRDTSDHISKDSVVLGAA